MSTLHVIWLLSYISIASVSAAIVTPALPQIQEQYALNPGSVEWMVSAFLVGYVIGQLIYGPLANQYGRLKALRLGLYIKRRRCYFKECLCIRIMVRTRRLGAQPKKIDGPISDNSSQCPTWG